MNVEKVESLLERGRPAPPPPELRRRIVEAAALKIRPVSASRKPRFVEVMTMAASILMLLGTVTWLLRATPAVPHPAGPQGQPFEERRLTDQLPGESITNFVWSADGKHWACIMAGVRVDSPLTCVVVDGKKEASYSEIRAFLFGADGHYAYIAHDPTKGFLLVLDGVPQKEFDAYEQIAWSKDGRKLAFTARKGGRTFVVVDGKQSEPFDNAWNLMWSPDGRTVAFSARLGQDWFCVVDGKKGEPFDGIRYLTFSPDGKTFAYAANEGAWMMVVGEEKGPEYDMVGSPVFSSDGKTYGYIAAKGDRALVAVGPGQLLYRDVTPWPSDEVGPPAFSRDGKVWAYRAVLSDNHREQVRVVHGSREGADLVGSEKPGAVYDSVSDPVVSPDGAQVAYAAGKGTRKYLVVGEKVTMKFSLIDRLSFGPDGRTLAFRAEQYGKQLVLAGTSRSDEVDEVVSGPVWSADGKKVAFTARNKSELWSKVLEVK